MHSPSTIRGVWKRTAFALLGIAAACAALADGTQPAARRTPVVVGVLLDGPEPAGEPVAVLQNRSRLLESIERETLALTGREFDVRFPLDKRVNGDWNVDGVRNAVDRLLADPEVDIVVSAGVFSTNDVARRRDLPKPVIAAWAIEIGAQSLPFADNASGVRNLNYLVAPGSLERDLRRFREITRFDRVAVLVDALFLEAVPEIPRFVIEGGRALGIRIDAAPVRRSAAEALARIPPDTDAVYIAPLMQLSEGEFGRLIDGLNERGLPSFSLLGESEVRRGVLAGVRTETDLARLARRIAIGIQRVLLGEDAGSLPVLLDQPERLTINMETARRIRVFPSWKLLTEAEEVGLRSEPGPAWTLSQAVTEAVRANPAIAAAARGVESGEQDVRIARAVLRPRIDASASGVVIDDDRAAASLGSQAERTVSGSLSISQVVHSDAARANLTVSRDLQLAREAQAEVVRLDVALQASRAFLDVLRAETLQRVRKENLRLTESSLEAARDRARVGYTGPSEVYRWESELAASRSRLIRARNDEQAARALFNRVVYRPQEESFTPTAPTLDDPQLLTSDERLKPYIDSPQTYRLFRDFCVVEGLGRLPELRAIDAEIAARRVALRTARRAYVSPDVALQGDLTRIFTEGGEGVGGVDFPPPLDTVTLPQADRTDWSVALRASLPLFQGGERRARVRQAVAELARLRAERDDLGAAVELRIRAAVLAAGSSFPAIELAGESAQAARKNLDLVADAYRQGLTEILNLLDAQNAALVADLSAANAVYDFLLDLMEVQRSIHGYEFFVSNASRDAWFDRLAAYFEEHGMSPR